MNGAIFEVGRKPGAGFLGKAYETALLIELKERGVKAEARIPIKVIYKGHEVGEY
jgi:GxxExxY protein